MRAPAQHPRTLHALGPVKRRRWRESSCYPVTPLPLYHRTRFPLRGSAWDKLTSPMRVNYRFVAGGDHRPPSDFRSSDARLVDSLLRHFEIDRGLGNSRPGGPEPLQARTARYATETRQFPEN